MKLPLGRIAGLLHAGGEFSADILVSGYSIDSRTIAAGELFFAVRGENLEGHDFVADALKKGAAGAVVQQDQRHRFSDCTRLLTVGDSLAALQSLGREVRRLWNKPLLAITGSTGKTTTKEIAARLLRTRYRVLKSEGNLNNHFGLPLQLLRLEPEHKIAVVELGMSHAGEIAALAKLAAPTLGAVTNVAPVHLGFFASLAEIAAAKKELIDQLAPDAVAVLNADDEYVSHFARDFPGRTVTFGLGEAAGVRAENIEGRGLLGSRFMLAADGERPAVTLPLLGRHNIYNALAAVAAGLPYGVTPAAAAAELGKLDAVDKRGQILTIGGATVVNDCYNSNPRALDCMVDVLPGMSPASGQRRIVVAGEMLELGAAGEDLHRRCGRRMAECGIDLVVGVRGLAKFMVEDARQGSSRVGASRTAAEFLQTPELAGEWLGREVQPGDVVLLKASRGVRLERALQVWRAKLDDSKPAPSA